MTSPELSIGAFARLVGLTPSALRFYDDCGLLHPARVDSGSGYRWYAVSQEPRARLLADLRVVDLPLVSVRAVLDGSPEEATRLLEDHLAAVEGKAALTRRAVTDALTDLHGGQRPCRFTLSGPELASAVRQVTPAAAPADRVTLPGEDPSLDEVLRCALLEVDAGEVRLVASDRYRLSVRTLHPRAGNDTAGRALVPVPDLVDLAGWARPQTEVTLVLEGDRLTAEGGAGSRRLPTREGDFPAYQAILDGVPAATVRAMVSRERLRSALEEDLPEVVVLELREGQLALDPPGLRLEAVVVGGPMRVGFAPTLLRAALEASVGPEVMLELSEPERPVLVRSADQGTFTTLVMPYRLDHHG
ncbi:MAG: MerR family DNA-binding transcriptional regulator [Oryzihumus sp.]